jgi:hypothetical protein
MRARGAPYPAEAGVTATTTQGGALRRRDESVCDESIVALHSASMAEVSVDWRVAGSQTSPRAEIAESSERRSFPLVMRAVPVIHA